MGIFGASRCCLALLDPRGCSGAGAVLQHRLCCLPSPFGWCHTAVSDFHAQEKLRFVFLDVHGLALELGKANL